MQKRTSTIVNVPSLVRVDGWKEERSRMNRWMDRRNLAIIRLIHQTLIESPRTALVYIRTPINQKMMKRTNEMTVFQMTVFRMMTFRMMTVFQITVIQMMTVFRMMTFFRMVTVFQMTGFCEKQRRGHLSNLDEDED